MLSYMVVILGVFYIVLAVYEPMNLMKMDRSKTAQTLHSLLRITLHHGWTPRLSGGNRPMPKRRTSSRSSRLLRRST